MQNKQTHYCQLEAFCTTLSHYQLIEIQGIDAEKYLQGQLTCDVTQLANGNHTLTAHCDPKGKVSAIFRLYRHSETQFFIIIHRSLQPEALNQLKKYAVFSKVVFTPLEIPILATNSEACYLLHRHNAVASLVIEGQAHRYLLWGNIEWQNNAESEVWDLLDIQQGLPILLKENQFELIPQAMNLQMVEQAISFKKGCYIGQETVARAKYRGANKRAMFILTCDAPNDQPVQIGSPIEMKLAEHWKQTGTILSAVKHSKLWLQVILNKEIDPTSEFRLNGMPLLLQPLPYSLEE